MIALFGCGGNRDAAKRPLMGEIAGELADYCILTSDNPRNEDPFEILREIEEGIRHTECAYTVIENRREAIRAALEMAQAQRRGRAGGQGTRDLSGNQGREASLRREDRRGGAAQRASRLSAESLEETEDAQTDLDGHRGFRDGAGVRADSHPVAEEDQIRPDDLRPRAGIPQEKAGHAHHGRHHLRHSGADRRGGVRHLRRNEPADGPVG